MPPVEEKIRRAIRDARAKDPLVSIVALQETLERQFNRTFTREYLAKLSDKVARQTLVEIDRAKIEERMNFTRESYRMAPEKHMEITCWDKESHPGGRPPQKRDIVEAAKSVAMLDPALLKAEIECGMYKKANRSANQRDKLQASAVPEVRAVVIAAWQRGGLLPAGTVEQIVPRASYYLLCGKEDQCLFGTLEKKLVKSMFVTARLATKMNRST